jgi:AcrR family transcriptional regulator
MTQDHERLSRKLICAAALELIDEAGLDALTMDALGATLSVTGMALYRHFPSKTALLAEVVETLHSSLAAESTTGRWQDQMRAPFLGIWQLYRAHPNILPLAYRGALGSPSERAGNERAREQLVGAGFAQRAAHQAVAECAAYSLGFAGLVAGGYGTPPSGRTRAGGALKSVDWAAAERDYLAGLNTVIAGIELERRAPRDRNRS